VLSEVLEYLPDPARALGTLRDCLKAGGRMFVTMAINIAQEDHVFLYPAINSCREQIQNCGLSVTREWISPQTIFAPLMIERKEFKKGNYIAVREKKLERVSKTSPECDPEAGEVEEGAVSSE
jgi:trans-aconitate methyltransferase